MAIQAGVTFTRHGSVAPPLSGGSVMPSASEDLTPWAPSATDPWDLKKVRHLSRRAGFGLTPEEQEKLLAVGHKIAIDIYLAQPGFIIPERGTYLLPSGEPVNLSNYQHSVAANLFVWTVSPYQLPEKLTVFWHDHFATGINKVLISELMNRQMNVFRRLGLGSFRDLLIAISADPAMLDWLDNRLSTAGRPNENYAREIMELFSMGVDGGYTEQDVKEAARCFTGWTNQFDYVVFNAGTHDNGTKTVLGQVIANGSGAAAVLRDGIAVVDAILKHPSTAKYMARKLWEYFVYEEPSQALVDKLADVMRKNNYEIRPFMETMFRSRAFFSAQAMRANIANPVEYLISALRNMDTTNLQWIRLSQRFLGLGLPLLNYQSPDGLPDGAAWINSQNVIARVNLAMELIERRSNPANSFLRTSWNPAAEIQRKNIDTSRPEPIVDHFLSVMVDGDVPQKVRDDLVAYMTAATPGWSWPGANNRTLNEKVPGLMHLILALPERHIA